MNWTCQSCGRDLGSDSAGPRRCNSCAEHDRYDGRIGRLMAMCYGKTDFEPLPLLTWSPPAPPSPPVLRRPACRHVPHAVADRRKALRLLHPAARSCRRMANRIEHQTKGAAHA